MKVLLFGKDGHVGRALQPVLAALGPVCALGRVGGDGLCGDLRDLSGIAATVRALWPDVVVNAAAYTDVDGAERDAAFAWRVNAQAPGVLAQAAAACGAWLVHYGSDYVFDGRGRAPWTETDEPAPLNAYGRSKLAGEHAVRASGCRYLLLRTSWVYAAQGRNFVRAVLERARVQPTLTVVADQWGAPTSARLVADATVWALAQAVRAHVKAGLYHVAAAGAASRLDCARLVLDTLRACRPDAVPAGLALRAGVSSAAHGFAPRPLNSRLDTRRFQTTFGYHFPAWQDDVVRTVREIAEAAP